VTSSQAAAPPLGAATGADDRAYRRLALATIVATFALVLIGGIVRVSDSGLGCGPAGSGFHGWPFCNGDVVPGLDLNTIVEYTHRAVAGIVGLMMIALAALAWRRHRGHRALVRAAIAAALLVVAQGLLGAATVENDLDETLVAAHLALAMALLALTIYIWRASKPQNVGAPAADGGPRLRPLALASSGLALCAIVAGGYMAGTQNYGRADYQLGDGAHHACGKEFPSCNGGFLPFGDTRLVDIHLTHRAFMYLASVLLIALIVVSLRRRVAVPYALALIGLLVAQILVGALNVWLDEYEWLIVLHLALGTLLWATTLGLTLQVSPARERAHGRAEAVAA
jgi:heme a synthase